MKIYLLEFYDETDEIIEGYLKDLPHIRTKSSVNKHDTKNYIVKCTDDQAIALSEEHYEYMNICDGTPNHKGQFTKAMNRVGHNE
jgi:hypothetical protein